MFHSGAPVVYVLESNSKQADIVEYKEAVVGPVWGRLGSRQADWRAGLVANCSEGASKTWNCNVRD